MSEEKEIQANETVQEVNVEASEAAENVSEEVKGDDNVEVKHLRPRSS